MKKILFLICALCVCLPVFGKTTNWYVDDSVYDTTTCQSGDNVTPPTPPAKYGHTFKEWVDPSIVIGTVTQNGTPTPDNPIYPTFYQNGDLILRAINDDNNNLIADTYSSATGQIVRRIGVKMLDGTEFVFSNIETQTKSRHWFYSTSFSIPYIPEANFNIVLSSHFVAGRKDGADTTISRSGSGYVEFLAEAIGVSTIAEANRWLAAQYAAGTPVTIYYPLATPVIENYTPSNP